MISERKTRIERAKEVLPITKLWGILGCQNEPKVGKCKSPFRKDNDPSFLITETDTGWVDFSSGQRGDAIDFIEQALGLTTAGAMVKLLELAGLEDQPKDGSEPRVERRIIIPPVEFVEYKAQREIEMPTLFVPTEEEIEAIATLRSLTKEAVAQAVDDGLLWVATVEETPAWVIADRTKVNAQARRMDGEKWFGNGPKALTVKGSYGSWPVGIGEAYQKGGLTLVCEGGPDLLAGYQLLQEKGLHGAPVAFFGASNRRLHPGALPFVNGMKVCIIPHNDWAGLTATYGAYNARNSEWSPGWVDVFTNAGAHVSVREIPMPVNDLNDYLKIPLVHRQKML